MICFPQKIKILLPNIKYQRINGENWADFIIVKFQNFDFFKCALLLSDRFWANILYVPEFFWAESLQKTCLYVHEKLQRNPSVGSCLIFFYFLTLLIWLFGIFDKGPQGCNEVKNSMGLLQGPRLMAWTTKSPILENHWVPWGCMAHLGSVKFKVSKGYKQSLNFKLKVLKYQWNFRPNATEISKGETPNVHIQWKYKKTNWWIFLPLLMFLNCINENKINRIFKADKFASDSCRCDCGMSGGRG